jgi:6-phosphogluconolactonase
MADIEIVEDAKDSEVATWLHERLRAGLARSGSVAITVPGGTTPFPILADLVQRPLDWARVSVWPGDDRLVPEDHVASNTGKIRSLFEPTGAEVLSLEEACEVPHFALAWLGMGADGHIASLFPSADPRPDDPQRIRRLVPDPLPQEAPFPRITLTMPALLDSDALLFVIRGAEKRALFEAAARGENDLPIARLLAARRQKVTCFT